MQNIIYLFHKIMKIIIIKLTFINQSTMNTHAD